MNSQNLAAVVVTFHPTQDMLFRLQRYAEFMGHVVVVDNTEPTCVSTLDAVEGITYLPMETNSGLGVALNAGAEHASRLGFKWAVLLDQDSTLTAGALTVACSAISDGVGIVTLRQVTGAKHKPLAGKEDPEGGCIEVRVAMTSGSILNLSAFDECGPFASKLFIDYVDHDYCLRLRRAGYRIVQCRLAELGHVLGEPKLFRCAGRSLSFTSHRPFRSYYIVRNGLYVATKYFADDPGTAFGVIKVLFKEFTKAIVLEDESLQRLRFMTLGLWHWVLNRYGRKI